MWKAMHNPKWEEHGEAPAFFETGKYVFAISKSTTPESLITSLTVGDRLVVQPRTMFGENNRVLKNEKKLNILRYGTITAKPTLEEDQKGRTAHPLYFVSVEWEEKVFPYDPKIKNHPCKTFTLIN